MLRPVVDAVLFDADDRLFECLLHVVFRLDFMDSGIKQSRNFFLFFLFLKKADDLGPYECIKGYGLMNW